MRLAHKFHTRIVSRLYIRAQEDLQRISELTEPLLKHRYEQEAIYGAEEWTAKPVNLSSAILALADRVYSAEYNVQLDGRRS